MTRILNWLGLVFALGMLTGCAATEVDDDVLGPGQVRLDVVRDPAGRSLAFVSIKINGQGPYRFALDTGASQSVVSRKVADELGLNVSGSTPVAGIVGATRAGQARIRQWSAGNVRLPASNVAVLSLGSANDRVGMNGLLGSDVLRRFRVITINYGTATLTLNPGASRSG